MKKSTTTIVLLLCTFIAQSQTWQSLVNDFSINFYDVCLAAETHFDTIDISIKGSGYKNFQRWKYDNEHKYYPSGNRSNVDYAFAAKQYDLFLQNNPTAKSLFNAGWEELGPSSPGTITRHHTFGMGRLTSFYVDPNNSQRLYIGSKTGGFWKSLDGGTTWAGGSTDFLPATGISTIAVSPTNPDSILISVNNSQNYYTHGIYRSVDGGDNWIVSNFNPTTLGWGGLGQNARINKVKYHPTNPNLVFIATRYGLYRSSDNLATWTIPTSSLEFNDIDFHPTNPNIVYAYSEDNAGVLYISADSGVTFNTSVIPGNSARGKVKTVTSCTDCIYFMSSNGIWKSTDNGSTFSIINNPGLSALGFAVNDLDTTKMIAGYIDAFASGDGGLTFNQVSEWNLPATNGSGPGLQNKYNTSTNYIHADLQEADCINGIFYAVTDGFLVSTEDNGANWNILSEDIAIRMNYNLGVSQSNHSNTLCGSQDNGTSVKTENGWLEMYGADGLEGFIHPLNTDWMFFSVQQGGRKRTINGGINVSGETPSGQTGSWTAPLFFDPNNHMTVYSCGGSIYRSDDFGLTWTTLGGPSFSGNARFASIAENNSNIMIAAHTQYIEKTDDGGLTWTNIKGTLPNLEITDIVFDPNNDSTVIVTYASSANDNSKVYITHDLGANWSNITYNLGNMPIRCALIDHTDSSTIYLGAEIGIYKKTMSSNTWVLYNTDLPNVSVREMEIMYGSNTLKAATWGRGLWEFTVDGRLSYPSITTTDITNTPTLYEPKETIEQFVSSTILYDNAITSAYLEWSIDNPTFGNITTMSNISGDDWISDTPLPDYPAGTKMYFKVFAVGSANDTTETYKFMYTVKPFEYCGGTGVNNGSTILNLTNVNIANINNSSGNNNYIYYGNEVVELNLGDTYSITLTGSVGLASIDYSAWIDFNNNKTFDPDETILMVNDVGSNSATASFTVPTTAVLEDTLRLRTRFSKPNINSPCGQARGEVEDYPVWITCTPSTSTEIVNSCDSFSWIDGNTYNSSNTTATHSIPNAMGCDSIITLNLSISNSSVATDFQSTCDPYTWIDGNTYTSSNNSATHIVTNSVGCDSTITLDLILLESTNSTDIQEHCNSYTWIDGNVYTSSNNTATFNLTNAAGCDSLIMLDLTINNENTGIDTQSACNSYTWIDGNTYVSSNNTATHTISNSMGCDSIVTLNLTINTIDATVQESNLVLTAMPNGAIYQWIDCNDNNTSIAGATGQSFTPIVNGSYGVVTTQNNCSDTSECFIVNTIGISENSAEGINIYPNPSNGNFTIQLSDQIEVSEIRILDMTGRLVYKNNSINSNSLALNIGQKLQAGTYYVLLKSKNETVALPILIK